jgi:Integrase core domain
MPRAPPRIRGIAPPRIRGIAARAKPPLQLGPCPSPRHTASSKPPGCAPHDMRSLQSISERFRSIASFAGARWVRHGDSTGALEQGTSGRDGGSHPSGAQASLTASSGLPSRAVKGRRRWAPPGDGGSSTPRVFVGRPGISGPPPRFAVPFLRDRGGPARIRPCRIKRHHQYTSRFEWHARALGALWKEEYNTERPHSSLRYKTPAEFSATCVRYVPIDENLPDPASTESTNR